MRCRIIATVISIISFGFSINGQVYLGEDTANCGGSSIDLIADVTSNPGTTVYTFASIPFTPEPYTGTNIVPLFANPDDGVAGPFNIGFNFCFMGDIYTQFWIGTNGWISFSANQSNNWNALPIPSTAVDVPKNCIMGPWQDWDFGVGANPQLLYQTTGIAPNRKLVVSFVNVALWTCNSTIGTFQIVLNETTNLIENFLADKPFCSQWSNIGTQGIHNLAGTIAYTVPNRNATSWTATNEGWQFIPGGPAGYTVTWYSGGSQVGSGDTLTVSPLVTSQYIAELEYICSGSIFEDTILVNVSPSPVYNVTKADVSCNGGSDGSASINVTSGNAPYTYAWNTNPVQTTSSVSGLNAGVYSFSITDSSGCMVDALVSITEPAPLSIISTVGNTSCFNASDGFINVNTQGGVQPYSYIWSTGQTSPSLTGLSAGSYQLTVTDDSLCVYTGVFTVTEPDSLESFLTVTDVGCHGGFNGSVSSSVTGGTPPYSYQWSNGQVTGVLVNLFPGLYTLTVTDSKGCTAVVSGIVSEPADLTVQVSAHDLSCFGANDGSVAAHVTGGTPPYSYGWNNGGSGDSLWGLGVGSYFVTVTDSHGCLKFGNGVVLQPAPMNVTVTPVGALCAGSSTGSLSAGVFGGTAPYSYQWSNGQTGQTDTSLSAGTYGITVTDVNGCSSTGIGTVGQPASMTVVFGGSQVFCHGASTGSVTATAVGGTSPYSYQWSGGQTGSALNGLPAGTYVLTVTDNGGCTVTDSFTVTEPAALLLTVGSTGVSCQGQSDGSAVAQASGGTGTLGYVWSTGSVGASLQNLGGGIYTVTVTDNNGCTATDTAWVSEPPALTGQLSMTPETCTASDGTVTVTAGGGEPPYTYQWSNGPLTASQTGIPSGLYAVTVTDSGGCTYTGSMQVSQGAGTLSHTLSMTPETCTGQNGSAASSASGGTPPYAYQWSNGPVAASQTGLVSGMYILTVTDASGCVSVDSIQVQNDPGSLSVTASVTGATCHGLQDGWAYVTASGGGSYTYQWTGGGSSDTSTGLPAGLYGYTVTDANGCYVQGSVQVTEPAALQSVASGTGTACYGGAGGTVQVQVSGGSGSYTYIWSNSSTQGSQAGLPAGVYYVTATDVSGCTVSDTATVTSPPQLAVQAGGSGETCWGSVNGRAWATVSGGTPGYGYQWTGGGSTDTIQGLPSGQYTVTVTDAGGCTGTGVYTVQSAPQLTVSASGTGALCHGDSSGWASGSASGGTPGYVYTWSTGIAGPQATGLPAGTYTLTATDAAGCTATAQASVSEPPLLQVSAASTDEQCTASNGTVSATATGGVPGYGYLWSTGSQSAVSTGLPAGQYTVTVTDAGGCTATAQATVLNDPGSLLSQVLSLRPVSCQGLSDGYAKITGLQGQGPYSYQWSTGAQGDTLSGAAAGLYGYTVTDANGCYVVDSVGVVSPSALSAGLSVSHIDCLGSLFGSASSSPSGGSAPYVYTWSTGGSGSSITSLSTGYYYLTVTDAGGCTALDTAHIQSPGTITLSVTGVPPSCGGQGDGSATAMAGGGILPYTYTWSSGASGPVAQNLSGGVYYLTLTDAGSCTAYDTVTLTEPSALGYVPQARDASCAGVSDGYVRVTLLTGGTGPYSHIWSTGAQGDSSGGLAAGVYGITVTDSRGCSLADSATVGSPQPLQPQLAGTGPSCHGGSDGSAQLTVQGGVPPYTLLWTGGQSTYGVQSLPAGPYGVTVTDTNGCTAVALDTLVAPSRLQTAMGKTDIACNGGSTGQAVVQATGGSAPYSYQWSTGGTAPTVQNLGIGQYRVTVTDARGCTAHDSVSITQSSGISITVTVSGVACHGGTDGSATATVTGGSPPYVYTWPAGGGGPQATGLAAGSYGVTATDGSGCQGFVAFTVGQPAALQLSAGHSDANCTTANGRAWAGPSGGTQPYSHSWSTGGSGDTLTGVPSGLYGVTVEDGNGCRDSARVGVGSVGSVTVTAQSTDISCHGAGDGTATATGQGGGAPYSYIWSSGGSGAQQTGLGPGVYSVTASDIWGCEATAPVTLSGPAELKTSLSQTGIACNGGSDGTVTATVSGGTGQSSLVWGDGGTGAVRTGLSAGSYSVTATDSNGCTSVATAILSDPPAVKVTASGDVAIAQGSGVLLGASAGPGGPYSYQWSPPGGLDSPVSQGPYATPDSTVTYVVTAVDANGCSGSDSLRVEVLVRPRVYIPNAFTPNGDGRNDRFAVTGGVYDNFLMEVYSRWGELVYRTGDQGSGWDGTHGGGEMGLGVYVYYIRLTDQWGALQSFRGNVHLLR